MNNIRKFEDLNGQYFKNLQEQRQRFQSGQSVNKAYISDVVLKSWERSRQIGACDRYDPVFVSGARLIEAQEKNALMLQCAVPIIESIFSSLVGHGNSIGVSDANGLILYSINDQHVSHTCHYGSETGLISDEKHLGTYGYGTCIAETKTV